MRFAKAECKSTAMDTEYVIGDKQVSQRLFFLESYIKERIRVERFNLSVAMKNQTRYSK